MPAGLEIYNSHGTVQINSTSRALGYVQYMTPTAMTGGFYLEFAPSASTMLAIVCNGQCSFAYRMNMGNGIFRYYFWGGGSVREVYRFEPMTTPTAKVGLQVFNEAGECCFDSAQLPAKVVAILGPVAGSLPVPAGKKYAVVTVQRRYASNFMRWTDDINWYEQQTNFSSMFYMTPGWVHFNPAQQLEQLPSAIVNPDTPTPPNYVSGNALYYVLDVTGY